MTKRIPVPMKPTEAVEQRYEVALETACAVVLDDVPLDFALWHAASRYEVATWPGFAADVDSAIDCERQRIAEERG